MRIPVTPNRDDLRQRFRPGSHECQLRAGDRGKRNPAQYPSTVNSPAGVIVTIPTSQVNWGGCSGSTCTLSVPAPAVASGTDYFVTVTTPGGTSPYLSPSGFLDFKVTNVIPTVTGISGAMNNGVVGGSITGGGTIALTGSGFYNASNFAAQVWLLPVGGGSPSEATNVNVASGTSLTAVAPAVNSPGNYYVQVDTLGGNSATASPTSSPTPSRCPSSSA